MLTSAGDVLAVRVLLRQVQGSKGGALLNLIRSCESGGDDKSAKLHSFLLQRVRTHSHHPAAHGGRHQAAGADSLL